MVKWHKMKHQLTERNRAVLDTISRDACKYTGVCYLSKQKIAEDAGYKTRRTAIRACKEMEDLGILKQYETRRVAGDKRQSVNIIVIQNVAVDLETDQQVNGVALSESRSNLTKSDMGSSIQSQQAVTAESHNKKAFNKSPIKTNTSKETCKETEMLLEKSLKHSIPTVFYNAFSPFFYMNTLYEIYGVLLRAKASINPTFMLEDHAEDYIGHFHNVIRLYKWGKVKSLANYLYVTWERLTAELSRRKSTRASELLGME